MRSPLTLIAAPAGYGKTTLMVAWRAAHGRAMPVAWLSLDEGDNDPARFWFYLISALGTLQSDMGIDFLLEHIPLHMHLVLLTRTDPPLAISRLRGRGQLVEICAHDLSFTPEEATAL